MGSANGNGKEILRLARRHIGERYVLGALAPKNDPGWKGPWDCAEFASWLVFQVSGELYGCNRERGNPATADAFTGFWKRDAGSRGRRVSVDLAARTAGAAVLRSPRQGSIGHIAISNGSGDTVEAHSAQKGVIASTVSGRVWDMGILVPGIRYEPGKNPVRVGPPKYVLFRLKNPRMRGTTVLEIQRRLRKEGFPPGPADGLFGTQTHAAVVGFQASRGLLVDGQVGPQTARALGITLPPQDR